MKALRDAISRSRSIRSSSPLLKEIVTLCFIEKKSMQAHKYMREHSEMCLSVQYRQVKTAVPISSPISARRLEGNGRIVKRSPGIWTVSHGH